VSFGLKAPGHRDEVTVIGSLPSVSAGEWLSAEGWWVRDKEKGWYWYSESHPDSGRGCRFRPSSERTERDGLRNGTDGDQPGMESAFEHGVAQAVPLFQRARGCHGLRLLKWIEQSSRYTLMVTWETVDDHVVHFRQSEDYKEWRRLVGECFASKSQVTHSEIAVAGF